MGRWSFSFFMIILKNLPILEGCENKVPLCCFMYLFFELIMEGSSSFSREFLKIQPFWEGVTQDQISLCNTWKGVRTRSDDCLAHFINIFSFFFFYLRWLHYSLTIELTRAHEPMIFTFLHSFFANLSSNI